jgi:polyhydroxybutyrate depolymerase
MDSLRGEGMAVVFPQAEALAGRGYAWDHERDLAYLAAVVEQVRTGLGADGSPVFFAGMSGGARMACAYAAARADEVAAVAAVAGLRSPQLRPARPVPIVAFHGLADRINPYLGGRGDRWRESVPEAAAAWAAANGVESSQTATEPGPGLTKTTYGEGTQAEVTLWTFAHAGHTWPGRPVGPLLRLLLGRTSTEVDATHEIGRFFSQAKPEAPRRRV